MTVDSTIIQEVKKVLKGFGDTYLLETGALKRSKLIEDLDKYTPILMKELLANALIAKFYTEKIGDTTIFKLNQFIEMFTYKEYWEDSYTKYSNKIGLSAGGKFIDETADVVLDFPFKDTVLKAGMTKEDDKDADEPFLNEVIAKSEIDTLFEPKIFVNSVKYDAEHPDGKPVNSFSDDDNLIIKGNNLIALHSIKTRYAGKVKLIYLDPPYNTGSDSFAYNDRFNHATWLTFMKSRLEIARELLSDDGVIAVQLNDSEGPYLKVLMDSIFGRKCEMFTQYILVRYADKTLKSDMDYHKQVEQIHYYKKSENATVIPNKDTEEYDYSKFIYKFKELSTPSKRIELGGKKVDVFESSQIELETVEPSENGLKEIWASGTILDGNSSGRFFRDYLTGRVDKDGLGVVYRVWGIGDDDNDYRYFTGPQREGATKGKYYQGVPTSVKSGEVTTKLKPVEGFIDMAGSFGNIRNEGGVELRGGKKPEKLLAEIIERYSNENDLVLDFFGGSGSTAATAHKMNRRYITIEQIDEQLDKIKQRLSNVINGDQTGISKSVNWQGGGSFVYAELFEKNQGYLKDLLAVKDNQALEVVYYRLVEGTSDLDFRVDLDTFKTDTQDMNFTDRKKLLLQIIDKNQLYYQYSEIDDIDVRDLLSDEDFEFNKKFYGEKELW